MSDLDLLNFPENLTDWINNQLENTWRKIVGTDSPKSKDGELLIQYHGEYETAYTFIYKGRIRANAKAYFNFKSGTYMFEYSMNE